MKKTLLFISMWLVTIAAFAQSWPAALPSTLGNGRLKVVSQNCKYYYTEKYSTSDNCDYSTEAEMLDKTQKLAKSLVHMDADIYAFCEVEANDTTLCFLAAAMNQIKGENVYVGLKDGLTDSHQWCKNGYLYRKDRVAPVGNNTPGTNQGTTYKYRMRIQAFKELATSEIFVLSTNHFKAKDSSDDKGQSTRNSNASNLLTKLAAVSIDPDILVVGDLNEMTSEPAVQSLINAGYEEQLEKYETNPYSYYYSGNQLIDHILANSTMASQITGAGAFHINTKSFNGSNKTNFRYSDHDPVMLAMNLGGEININPEDPNQDSNENPNDPNDPNENPNPQSVPVNNIVVTPSARKIFLEGTIYILREGDFYTLDGKKIQ